MYALQTKNLSKVFGGVYALDHLSVFIEKGSVTGIVGPNGSGKTTLTNVLTGIHKIDSGAIVISGKNEHMYIRAHDVFRLGITRTFQNIRLFEQMSVFDNIFVVLTKRGVWGALMERSTASHKESAKQALLQVGLWEKRHTKATELSYGQRKLLEIARALATDADTILLDEPFSGLFPGMVKTVASIIKNLHARGKTIVLIEHDMALIRELCERVIVLDAGRFLTAGKPEEVLRDPKVIEAYLGV